MSSDPIIGLTRRTSTDLVNRLLITNNDTKFFDFQTKNGSKFLGCIHNNIVSVYDANGNAMTCNVNAASRAYLSSPSSIRTGTKDNTTYLANKDISVSMLGDVKTYRNQNFNQAIVSIIAGAYGRKYTLSVGNTVISEYFTPDGSQPAHVIQASPHFIMGKLIDGLIASNYNGDMVLGSDGVSVFVMLSNSPFILRGGDDAGGTNMKVVQAIVNRIEDLPARCVDGYVVRVASKADPEEDIWYQFKATVIQKEPGDGSWQECVAPNLKYKLNPATLPQALTYDPSSNSFSVNPGTWKDRQVGTDVSNPQPSFVGDTINDVSSFQGRLLFLSGPNLVMSRTNRETDFWQASATALADTDPIDISSTSVQGALLAAVAHNRDLVIFSKKGQFVVYGRALLSPKTASMVLTTSFEADLTAKPVPAGRNVFFTTNYGRFTGVREFFTEGATDVNDSRPITQHVKQYIEGTTTRIAASSNYETLLAKATGDNRTLYVYQYIWADNNKVQSAWSKWTFHADIKHMWFDEEVIYVVMNIGNEYYLYRLSLDQSDSEGVGFPIYMDSRFDVLGVTRAFALPYDHLHNLPLQVIQGANCPNPGMTVRIASQTYMPGVGWVCTLKDSMRGGNLLVGTPYRSSFIPSQINVKDKDGVPIGTASLKHRSLLVSLSNTAKAAAMVLTDWGNSAEIIFSGRSLGALSNKVGATAIATDEFRIPIRQRAELVDVEIYTSGPYPMTLLDIEWQAAYNKKGQRVSNGSQT